MPLAAAPDGAAAAPADRGTLIVVGDVMGHGIAAALLMAMARSALGLLARQPADLGRVLTELNNALASDFRAGRFMTMALLRIDPATGVAAWASAGHESPIVYDPGSGSFRMLDGGDLPLGDVPGTEYREYAVTSLQPGSVLAIRTDGIWEARDAEGKEFGYAVCARSSAPVPTPRPRASPARSTGFWPRNSGLRGRLMT